MAFFAAVMGGLAVAMGAFAAHGLARTLDARMLTVFETGARYQMYHALAMGLTALAVRGAAAQVRPISRRDCSLPAFCCFRVRFI